jgi:HAD superfamily hydrolase (TIGR01509 family)
VAVDPAPSTDVEPLDAVLFDMDGLLVDSEPQWFAAETRTVHALGAEWGKAQQVDLLGSNLEYAAEYMIRHAGSDASVPDVMQLLCENMTDELARTVTFRSGALDLVAQLSEREVPMALVTSSVRVHVEAVLQHLPTDPFCHLVTAGDVERLKPHPEPYLTALALLGAEASRTVVLEDSPTGVEAAEAAGCHVVAVPSVVQIEPGRRRTVVPSLTEVSVDTLAGLVTRS